MFWIGAVVLGAGRLRTVHGGVGGEDGGSGPRAQSRHLGLVDGDGDGVAHASLLSRVAQVVVDPLGQQRLLEVELQHEVLAAVVPQQFLLVPALEAALGVGTAVGVVIAVV